MNKKIKILVAEDEPMLAELVGCWLEEFDFEVKFANNFDHAAQALCNAAAHGHQFDMVLTDNHMPRHEHTHDIMNGGIELLRMMKKCNMTIPTIFWSGLGTDEIERTARELGAVEVLQKPLPYEEFKRAIERTCTIAA